MPGVSLELHFVQLFCLFLLLSLSHLDRMGSVAGWLAGLCRGISIGFETRQGKPGVVIWAEGSIYEYSSLKWKRKRNTPACP